MNSMTGKMGDKELVHDGLLSQKQITAAYNTFAGECANVKMRDEFLNILKEEHEIQSGLFSCMQSNGWYTVENAQPQKVDQTRHKFPAK